MAKSGKQKSKDLKAARDAKRKAAAAAHTQRRKDKYGNPLAASASS